MTPDTLPLAEACARLDMGLSTAYVRHRAGEKELVEGVRFLRVGRKIKVSRYELDAFLGVPQSVSA